MRPGDLDDPTPLEPDDTMLERVHARSGALRHRRHLRRLTGVGAAALVVVLAVVVAIAVPVGDDGTEPNRPAATTTTTQPRIVTGDLEGAWKPVSIAGFTGPLARLAVRARLTFAADGKLSGSDGCNGFTGSYELGPDASFAVGEFGQTLMGCDDQLPLRETLGATARVDVSDRQLLLRGIDGRELARFVRSIVSARIELPTDTMVAGTAMQGQLVIDNQTGRALRANRCSFFRVALRNAEHEPVMLWYSCRNTFEISTGISKLPFTATATTVNGGSQLPLPPGTYEATLYQNGHVVPDPPPIPIQVTAPSTSVTARIELPSNTMKAGTTMKGTVVVQNDTGTAIHGSGCLNYFQILLESDAVQQTPGWHECLQQFTFPVGESSHPITVSARYNMCTGCGAEGPPDLPRGEYRATLFQSDDVVPGSPSVPVEVVAP